MFWSSPWFNSFNRLIKNTESNPHQGFGTGQSFIYSGYKQNVNKKKKLKNRAGKKARKGNRRKK